MFGQKDEMLGRALLGALLLTMTACGGASTLDALHTFPSQDELRELAAEGEGVSLQPEKVAAVSQWEARSAADAASAPALRAVLQREVKARGGVTITPELECAANELARFYVAHGALPDQRLRQFIFGSCDVTTSEVALTYQSGTADPSVSDEAWLASLGDSLTKGVREQLGAGLPQAGLGAARSGSTAAVVLASAAEKAEIDGPVTIGESRILRVSGRLRQAAEHVSALINQGAHGVAPCTRDLKVKLPRFAFDCAAAPEDHSAWIEIYAHQSGRVLAEAVADVLARDGTPEARAYALPSREVSRPSSQPSQFASAFVAAANRARGEAGLQPLQLAPGQSARNQALASPFFHAMATSNTELMDHIALGLLAGWDVDGGTIHDGNVATALLWGTRSPEEMVSYFLDRPMGRFVLLSPSADRFAVGPALAQQGAGAGVIITSYEFFDPAAIASETQRVVAELNRLREARGLRPARVFEAPPSLKRELARVRAYEQQPDAALELAMAEAAESLKRGVGGYMLATTTLERLSFPEELLSAVEPSIALELTHYKPTQGAWGHYVILMITSDTDTAPDPRSTARAPAAAVRSW